MVSDCVAVVIWHSRAGEFINTVKGLGLITAAVSLSPGCVQDPEAGIRQGTVFS